jgi:hypothetical protein
MILLSLLSKVDITSSGNKYIAIELKITIIENAGRILINFLKPIIIPILVLCASLEREIIRRRIVIM